MLSGLVLEGIPRGAGIEAKNVFIDLKSLSTDTDRLRSEAAMNWARQSTDVTAMSAPPGMKSLCAMFTVNSPCIMWSVILATGVLRLDRAMHDRERGTQGFYVGLATNYQGA